MAWSQLQEWLSWGIFSILRQFHNLYVRYAYITIGLCYSLLAFLIRIPSNKVALEPKHAVVVLNGTQKIAAEITLDLAQRGWTVFCHQTSNSQGEILQYRNIRPTETVSELMYRWNTIKRRNPNSQGELIPLSFNPLVELDRRNAVATIKAYCISQGIQLRALIIFPLLLSTRGDSRTLIWKTGSVEIAQYMERSISEPLLVIQDLLQELRLVGGRIFFFNRSQTFGPSTLYHSALQSMAISLRNELASSSVCVSLIQLGSVVWDQADYGRSFKMGPRQRNQDTSSQYQSSRLRTYFDRSAVSIGTVCFIIDQAITSYYPLAVYRIGLDVQLEKLFDTFMPDALRMLL